MAKVYLCDFCGADLVLETSIQKVVIGNSNAADLCFNCSQLLTNVIQGIAKEVVINKVKISQAIIENEFLEISKAKEPASATSDAIATHLSEEGN